MESSAPSKRCWLFSAKHIPVIPVLAKTSMTAKELASFRQTVLSDLLKVRPGHLGVV